MSAGKNAMGGSSGSSRRGAGAQKAATGTPVKHESSSSNQSPFVQQDPFTTPTRGQATTNSRGMLPPNPSPGMNQPMNALATANPSLTPVFDPRLLHRGNPPTARTGGSPSPWFSHGGPSQNNARAFSNPAAPSGVPSPASSRVQNTRRSQPAAAGQNAMSPPTGHPQAGYSNNARKRSKAEADDADYVPEKKRPRR